MTLAISNTDISDPNELAKRLISDEPALAADWAFGKNVCAGQIDAPTLFISNNNDIPLAEHRGFSSHEYRMSMLAGVGDMFVLRGVRNEAFEKYRQQILGLGSLKIVKLEGSVPSEPLLLDPSSADAQRILAAVKSITKISDQLNLAPYIGTENIWQLAKLIADQVNIEVSVAAPPPRLTKRVNDKLWFSERVSDLLGVSALPPVSSAFGPSALTGLVANYASRYPQVVVKVPDSAGSAGNMKLDSRQMLAMSEQALNEYLLFRLHQLGWHDRYPVMVEVWDSNVLSSPSIQLWLPDKSQGQPIIEGVFEQMLEGLSAQFVGATVADLPKAISDKR